MGTNAIYIGSTAAHIDWCKKVGVQTDPIDGNRSILDYDLVILDPAVFMKEIKSKGVISEASMNSLLGPLRRRMQEISELERYGRFAVFFLHDLGSSHINRNAIVPFMLNSHVYPLDLTFEARVGNNVQAARDDMPPLLGLAQLGKSPIRYNATLPTFPGDPLLRVYGTDRVVGFADWSAGRKRPGAGALLQHSEDMHKFHP